MLDLARLTAAVLRGVSQIFFIGNWWTGAFIVVAMAMFDPVAAIFLLLGSLTQFVGAWAMDSSEVDRRRGMSGFNGALIGVVGWMYSEQLGVAVLLAVLGGFGVAIVYALVEKLFSSPALSWAQLPVSTAPFCLAATAMFFLLPRASQSSPVDSTQGVGLGLLHGTLNGFSEVILADGPLTGALILLGLVIGAPRAAAYGVMGSAVGTCAGIIVAGVSAGATGLWSYSAVLTAMALGATFLEESPRVWRMGSAAIGAIVSVFVTWALTTATGPVFTWPYLLSMWMFMMLFRRTAARSPRF